MDKKYKEAFRGVYFFHFRRKNFQSNLVLVVVLVLESKGLHWHNNKDDNKNLLLEQCGGGGGGGARPTVVRGGGQPDPWIKGGPVSPKLFSVLLASVWSKNKEGRGAGPSPGSVTGSCSCFGGIGLSRGLCSRFSLSTNPCSTSNFQFNPKRETENQPVDALSPLFFFLLFTCLFIYLLISVFIYLFTVNPLLSPQGRYVPQSLVKVTQG